MNNYFWYEKPSVLLDNYYYSPFKNIYIRTKLKCYSKIYYYIIFILCYYGK